MNKVKVHKIELLRKVKENKELHDIIYESAVFGYWEVAESRLKKLLKDVKNKEKISNYLDVNFPVSHEDDYETAIAMLEMSVDSEIELDAASFAKLALNKWDWRASFLASNSAYGYSGYSGYSGYKGYSSK